jgi:hypothetical protein
MVLAVHALLLLWSATRHSPPSDEVGHLAAGLNHWRTGTFDLYRVNPPLVRLMATLPLAAAGLREPDSPLETHPPRRPEFPIGREFVSQHAQRAFWYFTVARWACVPFALLGGYICYRWAREVYGPRSGILAATLWCFCPLVLAHGQMITPDAAAAALGTLACYLFWRWLRQPDWTRAYWAGLALGVALLCKTTWLFLFLLWPLCWAGLRLTQRPGATRRDWRAQGCQAGLSLVLAVAVINAGYLFEGCFHKLGDYPFVSQALTTEDETGHARNRFAGSWLGAVPVPLPRNFVSGIDVQKRDFERKIWSYLRGEWRRGGWWYYYLYGLAVKWPLGSWLLLFIAGCSAVIARTRSSCWRDEVSLVLPGVALFVLVSSQTGFNHHLRYILPALPFAFIWMSRIAEISTPKPSLWLSLAGASVLWSAGSSLAIYPHSMSYFNELAGGPTNGSAHLVDSNIDWGQDLLYLKQWLDEHPEAQPLGLAYFGYIDPRVAGIEFSLPPAGITAKPPSFSTDLEQPGPQPGWFAVSATLLRGSGYLLADGKGGLPHREFGSYTYFLRFRPVATAGYSIFIYHIDRDECDRVRAELGLPPLPAVRDPQRGREETSPRDSRPAKRIGRPNHER